MDGMDDELLPAMHHRSGVALVGGKDGGFHALPVPGGIVAGELAGCAKGFAHHFPQHVGAGAVRVQPENRGDARAGNPASAASVKAHAAAFASSARRAL